MDLKNVLLGFGLLALCVLSVKRRVRFKILRQELPFETKPSVVSQALMELIAVAGGIYIALIATTAFLAVDVPERVPLAGLRLDPIAAVSLVISAILPFVTPAGEVALRSRRLRS